MANGSGDKGNRGNFKASTFKQLNGSVPLAQAASEDELERARKRRIADALKALEEMKANRPQYR